MVVGLMRQEVTSTQGVDATLTNFVAGLRAFVGST
jgi:hypothetical protein